MAPLQLFTHLSRETRSGRENPDIFASCPDGGLRDDKESARICLSVKTHDEHRDFKELPATLLSQQGTVGPSGPQEARKMITAGRASPSTFTSSTKLSQALTLHKTTRTIRPTDHPPWKSVAVQPGNQWFATGGGDRVIKIWDLASGSLKLSLTGHILTVRGLAVSPRHPYLFSCGEDKMVRCWDLEANKLICHYHGHLSGMYALSLHPTLDVLTTAGRDASTRESEPQVITGTMDSTVRLWDLAAGRRVSRSRTKSFASGSGGGNNIKKWKCPEGAFVFNFPGQNVIVNTLTVNAEGVFFSGADNGSLAFWDYKTGTSFQTMEDIPQPGSLEAKAGVFCSTFDMTGTPLITGGADKTIKLSSLTLALRLLIFLLARIRARFRPATEARARETFSRASEYRG
ncbi:WD40 repeat-like protein [Mycena metata]|uniref:Pre-mRNA-splicing factor PRP46 n=1 Tax=Mycena metata TaxID=1033252 RepID=A0AAD7JH74_9AGAR|nr:WD40 repeat-like protein [Mycena metata]